MRITVLRLGHRPQRDQRVTTHVGLTARALGAEGMLLTSNDTGIKDSIDSVTGAWGGSFYVKCGVSWKREIAEWKEGGGKVCHLTMYGLNLPDVIHEIVADTPDKLLLVVGAEKVPPDIYGMADWNVAVGNQPHSEVAALAITLDRLNSARGTDVLRAGFGGKLEIVPLPRGKRVLEK